MTYKFDVELAKIYGVEEAIMLDNFLYWIRKNEANDKHFHDGKYWTYNTNKALVELFPFWTKRQIERILKSLIEKGAIVTGNYNSSAYDRTIWYAIGELKTASEGTPAHFTKRGNGVHQTGKSNSPNGEMEFTKRGNGIHQTGKCIYIDTTIKPNIKPSEKPNIAADQDGGLFSEDSDFIENPLNEKNTDVQKRKVARGTSEPASCLFANSRFVKYEDFAAQFEGKEEFAQVDIYYYYNAVSDWSAQRGKKMKDWIATARNFMRSDAENNKLHTKIVEQKSDFDFEGARRYLEMGMNL